MEAAKERSGHGGGVDQEIKRYESSGNYEQGCNEETTVIEVGNGRPCHENDQLKPSSPLQKDSSCSKQDDQLQSARAKMGEVTEENQRLKKYLDRIMKDYHTLQMQFNDIVQQEGRKSTDINTANNHHEIEEPEFVSLSLGRVPSDTKKDVKNIFSSQWKEDEQAKEGLNLGLECKFELSKSRETESLPHTRPVNSSEEPIKEEDGERLPPGKVQKTMISGDDEVPQQNPVKRARVSVRARCDTPTMNDGCQWRKYGQKIAKANPCPRAYYRCTVGPSCPVRKQVQRCAEDMSILITTYEGTHNHPLPMSATAMASTTSAAASMLLSGSSSSGTGYSPSATTVSTAADPHGTNFYLSDNSKSKYLYLSNSSFSSSPSFPTITLDLTSTPSSSSSHFNRASSNYPPRYSPASLNFSSESNSMSWANGLLNYGTQPAYSRNQIGNLTMGRQPIENIYQSYMQKKNPTPPQHSLPDHIAAATKAITDDPSFQSALVAALTSIIGTGGGAAGGALGNQNGDNFGQKSTLGELFPPSSTFPPAPKGNGCASSFLNKTHSTNSQPGSLMFLPPSLPYSTSKSASASPGDNRDHTTN